MKRSAFLALALAALSVGLVIAAHGYLLGTADRVDFRETVYAGDASAVEGVTLTARQSAGRQLYWDSTLPLAAPERASTSFTARSLKKPEENWYVPSGLRMYFTLGGVGYSFGESGVDTDGLQRAYWLHWDGEAEAILAVAERTGAGETRRETLRIRDYTEYIPLIVDLDFGEATVVYWHDTFYSAGDMQDDLARRFNGYFRFPVPEDAELTVEVTKNSRGMVTELRTESNVENNDLDTDSVVTDGKCWFTVQGIGDKDLDFSAVPGGRGLYCLPFTPRDDARNAVNVDFDAMHVAFPLREDEYPVALYDGENGMLLLALRTEEGADLVMLDTETERVLQRFTLFGEEIEDANGWVFCPRGNQLYAACDTRVQYYERGADGFYTLLLDAPNGAKNVLPEETAYRTYLTPSALAWDGERLAVVTASTSGSRYDHGNAAGALLLTVYDQTGLRYCATLESGVMWPGTNSFQNRVFWGEYDAVTEDMLTLGFDHNK